MKADLKCVLCGAPGDCGGTINKCAKCWHAECVIDAKEPSAPLVNLIADALFSGWRNDPFASCELHDLAQRYGQGGPPPEAWREKARAFLRLRAELLSIREDEKRKYPER